MMSNNKKKLLSFTKLVNVSSEHANSENGFTATATVKHYEYLESKYGK